MRQAIRHRAGDQCDRGDAIGQLAAETLGHEGAVGQAAGENAIGIEMQIAGQDIDDLGVEADIIDARRVARIIVPLIVERSEEHTSELQSLMRISYAVFCLKKKK